MSREQCCAFSAWGAAEQWLQGLFLVLWSVLLRRRYPAQAVVAGRFAFVFLGVLTGQGVQFLKALIFSSKRYFPRFSVIKPAFYRQRLDKYSLKMRFKCLIIKHLAVKYKDRFKNLARRALRVVCLVACGASRV